MEITLGCGTFAEEHSGTILSPALGVTFYRVTDPGGLRELSGKGGGDGMEVIFRRPEMLSEPLSVGNENPPPILPTTGIWRPFVLVSSSLLKH